jgi:hypothetical protein
MLRMTSSADRDQSASRRQVRFPERGLHLIDIENLAAAARPSFEQIRDVQAVYAGQLTVGVLDQVVVASSHRTLLSAALGWPHARYRVRSGPDGADLELLDVPGAREGRRAVHAGDNRVMVRSPVRLRAWPPQASG